jgi:hypothetical protein
VVVFSCALIPIRASTISASTISASTISASIVSRNKLFPRHRQRSTLLESDEEKLAGVELRFFEFGNAILASACGVVLSCDEGEGDLLCRCVLEDWHDDVLHEKTKARNRTDRVRRGK